MPDQYTITTCKCNLEDVLHRLFTQLYHDDWLFDLKINQIDKQVEISFETHYTKATVQQVLAGYL